MEVAGVKEVETVEAIKKVLMKEDTAVKPTVLIELFWPGSDCSFYRRHLGIEGTFSSPGLLSGVMVRAPHNHG